MQGTVRSRIRIEGERQNAGWCLQGSTYAHGDRGSGKLGKRPPQTRTALLKAGCFLCSTLPGIKDVESQIKLKLAKSTRGRRTNGLARESTCSPRTIDLGTKVLTEAFFLC